MTLKPRHLCHGASPNPGTKGPVLQNHVPVTGSDCTYCTVSVSLHISSLSKPSVSWLTGVEKVDAGSQQGLGSQIFRTAFWHGVPFRRNVRCEVFPLYSGLTPQRDPRTPGNLYTVGCGARTVVKGSLVQLHQLINASRIVTWAWTPAGAV